jgi:hypothetical protein
VKHSLRTINAIAGLALAACAFALGYYAALPTVLRAPANHSDVVSAAGAALAKPSPLECAAGLAPILASLDARELEAVVGAFEATFTSGGPDPSAMEMLAAAWSKIDPAGALERIQGWTLYWQKVAMPPLIRGWARRDLVSARAAVETIDAKLRNSVSTAVILGWDESGDPGFWDAYIAGLPFGRTAAPDLIRRIGAREGIEALLRRVDGVPEAAAGGIRPQLLRQAVAFAAQSDPERAAAFAEAHRESAPELEGIVATQWAEGDGTRAAEWALARPSGPVREQVLRSAFGSWARSDPSAALEWAERQPDEVRGAFLDSYATALADTEPQRALEVSAAIADATRRRQIQEQLAQSWLAKQPEIASSWLEEHELGDLVGENRPERDRGSVPGPESRGGKGR